MTSTLFPIPGPITSDTPVRELHFWKWADAQGFRSDVTLPNYFTSLGFQQGVHHLDQNEHEILRLSVQQWHITTPWIRSPRKLTELFRQDKESKFYVFDKEGHYTPSAEMVNALVESGWVYNVRPDTTYFEVIEDRVYAKYQFILGSRLIARIKPEGKRAYTKRKTEA